MGPVEKFIFVVDDEKSNMDLFDRVLGEDYKVFGTGSELIAKDIGKALYKAGLTVDLLICDVYLGGRRRGPEIVEEVKRFHPDAKVLYVSGSGEWEIADELKAQNAEFLAKPFSPQDLVSKVRKLLGDD